MYVCVLIFLNRKKQKLHFCAHMKRILLTQLNWQCSEQNL